MLTISKMERNSFLCMELFQKDKRRLRGSCAVTGGSGSPDDKQNEYHLRQKCPKCWYAFLYR